MKTRQILLFAFAFTTATARAEITGGYCGYDVSEDVSWSYNSETKTLTISGTGEMNSYDQYNEDPGTPWYSLRNDITTLVVSDGVTSIGNAAFQGLSALTAVQFGNDIVSINDAGFCRCSSLTGVVLPEGLTYLGYYVFQYCSSLGEIAVPEGVTYLNNELFADCGDLIVFLPSSIDEDDISEWAFNNTNVSLCRNSCGSGVYYKYNSQTQTLAILGSGRMKDYDYGGELPYGNFEFTKIIVEEGVTYLGEMTCTCDFCSCDIQSITLSASVEEISYLAICRCPNLTTITIKAATPPELGSNNFEECPNLTKIIVPASSVDAYKEDGKWGAFASIIMSEEETVTSVVMHKNEDISVFAACGKICISGASVGSAYVITDLGGRTIATGKIDSSNSSISVNNSGVYFVAIGGQTFKVAF
ncbi:MAG: leucine-rich repeat protein [Bacteroidales bacterium]|nr:leucine-rich repeat protein [Bacteroidales bacterium]